MVAGFTGYFVSIQVFNKLFLVVYFPFNSIQKFLCPYMSIIIVETA